MLPPSLLFVLPVAALVLSLTSSAHAAASRSDATTAEAPRGVSSQDWSSIRAAYEAGRHEISADEDGTWVARNPGQRWHTRFDGRGFTVTPDAGGWTWGLELRSVGFAGAQTVLGEGRNVASVSHEQSRVYYDWSPALREWFVNDARGLEQGWTINERPVSGERVGSLQLELVVRGGLVPRVSDDAAAVDFVAANGGSALNFGGLRAWDADGKALVVRFEQAGTTALRVAVDESNARYPITVDPIAQQAYLKASNADAGDFFGLSVAVSGDTAVVGAFRESSSATGVNGNQANNGEVGSGAAYVFVRSGSSWTQQAYLKASNTQSDDEFGVSVAVSGDTVVVGAHLEDSSAAGIDGNGGDNNGFQNGAAYVFVRNGSTWTQQAYLKASNSAEADFFGRSVAATGDTVVVGAVGEDSSSGDPSNNGAFSAGAAYVFVRSGTSWSQQAYLKARSTAFNPEFGGLGDEFGFSVAASGDTVVVGAIGEDSNATGVDGNEADNSSSNAGAAYVFARNGTTWTQQGYLKASNTETADNFGRSVAVSGDIVVIGATSEDSHATGVNGDQTSNGALSSGAAYVFVRSDTTWTQQAYFKASNTGASDAFGLSVAVSGDKVVVGAQSEASNATGVNGDQANNVAGNSGAAYVFARSGTNWSQQAYLKASNTGPSDFFGRSVAVSGDTVVVGASGEDSNATDVDGDEADNSAEGAGAAYVFVALPPSPVIFIPGISGSTLVNHPLGVAEEVWVGFPLASRRALSLYAVDNPPPPNAKDIEATDATRYVEVLGQTASTIYGPLLEILTADGGGGGYREYLVGGFPFRRTTAGCDLTQFNADRNLNPNLFVFGYDWRQDNVETAAKLKDYVGCVRLFHPGGEITLLTHSMGGLVARRYVLDNPADHHVDKMITIVAPWLGAAKVLNVLETGDFIPAVASGADMKYIAPSLPAAAQLLASRAYFELGGAPMLIEDGVDADGDGLFFETYQYDDVVEYIDNRYLLPAQTNPGTTNKAFHAHTTAAGAQDDWSIDTTGVEYFHLYGVQAGNLTIAQLVARNRIVCEPLQIAFCRFTDVFDLRFTVGDATVPARSAGRSTSFGNYNAAPADHVFRFAVSNAAENGDVDHVEICQNPDVLGKVLELLDRDAASSTAELPGAASLKAEKQGAASLKAEKQGAALPVTDDELQSTIPSYYVTLDGATPVVVGDTQANSTATIVNDLRGSVPGVQTYVLGDGIEMVTLPVPVTEEYSISFLSNGSPIALDVIMGEDNVTPTEAVRYLDTTLPTGVVAQIRITPVGIGPLLYDSDANGTFDTLVPATVMLSGPAALDATPPIVTADQNAQRETTQVTLSASDSGSGVSALRYSLDGAHYQPYTATLSLNPAATPFVYAFADDNAGNRSSRVTIGVVVDIEIFQDGFE